jgi:hypothetical protein
LLKPSKLFRLPGAFTVQHVHFSYLHAVMVCLCYSTLRSDAIHFQMLKFLHLSRAPAKLRPVSTLPEAHVGDHALLAQNNVMDSSPSNACE